MAFGFLNLLMLAGMAGLAIPPIIHLLNRRRFDVVDWGAMQFLLMSETTRRRVMIEELLLMLLRMGLIGLLVFGLAGPWVNSSTLGKLGRPSRDVVILFDGSYSMGYMDNDKSAHDAAKEWAKDFIGDLGSQDAVAILQAKQQVVEVQPTLIQDRQRLLDQIQHLPEPKGGCDWPKSLAAAHKILDKSSRKDREIIVLTVNQRHGWADDETLINWELNGANFKKDKATQPSIWVVNLSPDRPKDPPNWSLAPLSASQTLAPAGWSLTFSTALILHGQQEYAPPYRVHLEIDGKEVRDLKPPESAQLEKGQVPLSFEQAFDSPGSHLVSVLLEPDPPPDQRPAGYVVRDRLPGDNRQDFAVEIVLALPVLLVDGDERNSAKRRGIDFLRDALAPASDRHPIVLAKVVSIQSFEPSLLSADLGPQPDSKPRVLVLSNVAHLSRAQQEAIKEFLAGGGGVLVTLGDRVDPAHYNDDLYRGGQGWLPAKLDDLVGDESKPERATSPLVGSFFHPALQMFRRMPSEGLAEARLPRWWKVSTPGQSTSSVPVALLAAGDPLLVERSFEGGRVLMCSVPLDNSWKTNLTSLPAFVPLAHELIYYLAGARAAEHNIKPGQSLRHWPESMAEVDRLVLQPPEGPAKKLSFDENPPSDFYPALLHHLPRGLMVEYEGAKETGVYRLQQEERTIYYVAQPDGRESDLTPCEDADRAKVAKFVDMTYENDRDKMKEAWNDAAPRAEVWWWCLLGVIGLLCCEVWMTRRLVMSR